MKYIYILMIATLLLVGCATNNTNNKSGDTSATDISNLTLTPTENSSITSVITDIVHTGYYGKILAGNKTPYIEFNTKDYEKAASEGKVILLYFHSDYSTLCKTDETKILKAFSDMSNNKMIGFKVHFEDSSTSDAEKQLATTLDVKDTRTKIILKDDKVMLKSSATWDINTYAAQMSLYLG